MKKSIKKTNAFIALFSSSFFSTIAIADAPKASLIKAEPIKVMNLTSEAHNSLKLSLTPIKLNYTKPVPVNYHDKQKQMASENRTVALTNTSLVAE